jgi:hypothetical protein
MASFPHGLEILSTLHNFTSVQAVDQLSIK